MLLSQKGFESCGRCIGSTQSLKVRSSPHSPEASTVLDTVLDRLGIPEVVAPLRLAPFHSTLDRPRGPSPSSTDLLLDEGLPVDERGLGVVGLLVRLHQRRETVHVSRIEHLGQHKVGVGIGG